MDPWSRLHLCVQSAPHHIKLRRLLRNVVCLPGRRSAYPSMSPPCQRFLTRVTGDATWVGPLCFQRAHGMINHPWPMLFQRSRYTDMEPKSLRWCCGYSCNSGSSCNNNSSHSDDRPVVLQIRADNAFFRGFHSPSMRACKLSSSSPAC